MAVPTIVGVGASAAGQAGVTPAFPVGYTAVADDIAVIGHECESGDTLTVPSGWTLINQQSVTSGTVTKLSAMGRRLQAGDTAPTIADVGNHQMARMIIVRGCKTSGTAWTSAVTNELTSDTSVSVLSITTPTNDCLVLALFSTGRDVNSTAEATGWTNANLSNLTEQMDNWTALGLGGGFAMATGGLATAGATGATTATVALANFKALMAIALEPAAATSAQAECATGTGTANNAAASIGASAGGATGTGTAYRMPLPLFRAAATNTTGTGAAVATIEVTIPSGGPGGNVVAGDLAYLWYSGVSTGLLTDLATPSGWTERLAPQAINGNTQTVALASKRLETADIGTNVGFGTLTANRRQNLSVTVFRNALHDSIVALASSATGTTTPPVPGIDPVAVDCMLVSFAAVQHPAANTALITSTPAGSPVWLELADFGTSTAAAVNHGSQEVQERSEVGGGAFSDTTFTTSHSAQYGAITIALAPVEGALATQCAAGTGTAFNATVTTGAGGTNAPAEQAVATGVADNITISIAPTAATATSTGTANAASASIAPVPATATGTGIANNPSGAVRATADVATATGTASNATGSAGPTAGQATGTGTANGITARIAPVPSTATATGVANNATVNTTGSTNAQAGLATATGTANNAGGSVSANTALATATAAANTASLTILANAAAATALGTAYDVTSGQAVVAGIGTVSVGYASGTSPVDTPHSTSSLVTAGGRASVS